MASRYRHIAEGWTGRLRFATDDRLMNFVRRGDSTAFEILYDRHASELLSFCVYMLGSRHDAEDAVQATFASAYRVLNRDAREVVLRPWLFTIARNNCLSILRRRRPAVELGEERAHDGDPIAELEVREELRHVLKSLLALPERQRAALVLAELHGLSQSEIGAVLGVRAERVKAYVYQARAHLVSDREAREADCRQIREELASARGAALLKSRLRRHLRGCPDCRTYADGLGRQRRQLGLLFPLAPSLELKYRVLEQGLGLAGSPGADAAGAALGASAAGAAAEIAGGGAKALVAKVATGLAVLGAGAGAGVAVLGVPVAEEGQGPSASASVRPAGTSTAGPLASLGSSPGTSVSAPAHDGQAGSPSAAPRADGAQPNVLILHQSPPKASGQPDGSTAPDGGAQASTEATRGGGGPVLGGNEAQRLERQHAQQERQRAQEERQRGREERLRSHEERQKLRQERKINGGGAPPPPSPEERTLKREERLRLREELKRGGGAPPPISEEERLRRREEHRRKREQREAKPPPPPGG
jgi:RNA polymerase sigma factor (sigma-70 family)